MEILFVVSLYASLGVNQARTQQLAQKKKKKSFPNHGKTAESPRYCWYDTVVDTRVSEFNLDSHQINQPTINLILEFARFSSNLALQV